MRAVLWCVVSLVASCCISTVAVAEERQSTSPPPPAETWWVPSYLIDYGVIATGAAGYFIGESLAPRPALFGPVYDPEDPAAIFTDPGVAHPYAEEGAGERVPTRWVEIGVASSILFVAGFEGAHWARGSGSSIEFHHALTGVLETTALTGATTSLSKPLIGRLRPDFGERALRYHCPREPDGFGEVCDGYEDRPLHEDQRREEKLLNDGRKSFISGHSSHGYNLTTYTALYLGGRYVWGHDATPLSRAVVVPIQVLLVSAGSYSAISRLLDDRHYTSDVIVGSLVGLGFANLSYWRRFHLDGTPRVRNRWEPMTQVGVAPFGDGAAVQLTLRY